MSSVSRRDFLAALSVATAGASTFGCRRKGTGGTVNVTLGVCALRISLPIFVAKERGRFEAHGVSVDLRSYPTAQPMIDDLLLGRLDAAGFAAYPIVFASAKSLSDAKDAPVLAASIVEDRAHRLSYALARKGAGISFPKGLAGKRVGILPTIAYQKWLAAILRKAGLAEREVTITPIAPAMQARALADGAIDVLLTNDPMATAILAQGDAEIVDDGPPCATWLRDPFPFGAFALGGPFARDRRADAERLVAAIDDAIDLVRQDPAAAKQAMSGYVRPDERAFVAKYPDARFFRSSELDATAVAVEVDREHELGVFAGEVKVQAWSAGVR
jgi:ABC-type nitrate/sulfonate/bicarbonate transport system substrate-binding protein